jgi:putative oxidoreductase
MQALCDVTKAYGPVVGRILISLLFLKSGIEKIAGFSAVSGFMASQGMPAAEFLLVGAIVLEIAGALMVMLGWNARWGALMLAVFIVPATLIFHNFWSVDAAQYTNQVNHFMKNLSILGALVFIMGAGAGPFSLGKEAQSSRVQ